MNTPFRTLHHIYESIGIEGVFHLGFEYPLAEATEAAAELGLPVLMRGERDNGTGFVYYDTAEQAGCVLLARQTRGD